MNLLRSALFNLAFYLLTAVMLVASLPFFFVLPQGFGMWVVRTWARACVFLHVTLAGVKVEVRGTENIPAAAPLSPSNISRRSRRSPSYRC